MKAAEATHTAQMPGCRAVPGQCQCATARPRTVKTDRPEISYSPNLPPSTPTGANDETTAAARHPRAVLTETATGASARGREGD